MQPLAKVTRPLSERRGPDVRCSVTVPRQWLSTGATIAVDPPRLASCAACDGGGCDACRSRGAFALRQRGTAVEAVTVHLAPDSTDRPQLIRLPDQGAEASEPECPRGCLLLEVQPGEEPSSGVSLVAVAPSPGLTGEWSPRQLVTVALLLALLLAIAIISAK